ncbi:hypothetical protein [Nonlabens dokdonensis]|uniref:hypothetical protein n=1 Tax=Nonlabens dokdonensis TaxID=328515 RepID=UPI0026E9A6F9|nr:hypothetical protein [Nonlabens dokdonensis]
MPVINQTNSIDVTPEKFLNACSDVELYETWLKLLSPPYQNLFSAMSGVLPEQSLSPVTYDQTPAYELDFGPGEDIDSHVAFLAGIDQEEVDKINVKDPELLDGHKGH